MKQPLLLISRQMRAGFEWTKSVFQFEKSKCRRPELASSQQQGQVDCFRESGASTDYQAEVLAREDYRKKEQQWAISEGLFPSVLWPRREVTSTGKLRRPAWPLGDGVIKWWRQKGPPGGRNTISHFWNSGQLCSWEDSITRELVYGIF